MKTIGLLINPIAGMGGKVGLKGTDGADIVALARERGAVAESMDKALEALLPLQDMKDDLLFLVPSGSMGEMVAKKAGMNVEIIYEAPAETTREDTLNYLEELTKQKISLLLFAGGDGTAKDIAEAIGMTIPAIGIPAGVKIHSPVFALTPKHAGELAVDYLSADSYDLKMSDVIDIEEEAFRQDEIHTRLYGILMVPNKQEHLQVLKSPSPQSETAAQTSAALQVMDEMEDGYFYIIGSGTTTSRLMEELKLPVTQLGVDIIKDGELVANDVNEQEILEIITDQPAKLVVTPMGGQGYLFGRGNQQLSDKVLSLIKKEDIIIVSTPGKINTLYGRPLWVYTSNKEIDEKLSGYYKIIVGYGKYVVYKVVSP